VTSITDTINRHVNHMVDEGMRKISDEIEIRRAVENSLDYVVTRLFSAEAIGRSASRLDGDRALAVEVIAAAFGAMDPDGSKEAKAGESSCERCTAPIRFTISGFTQFPDRTVCPNCGIMSTSGLKSKTLGPRA
jgi:hypothetical protein